MTESAEPLTSRRGRRGRTLVAVGVAVTASAAAAIALAVPALADGDEGGQPRDMYVGVPMTDFVEVPQPPQGPPGEYVTNALPESNPANESNPNAASENDLTPLGVAVDAALDEGAKVVAPTEDLGVPGLNGQDEPPPADG